jgi:peptidoglycan/xylan/chitin deacetylase (PgdA/CDA1 family)
MLTIGRRASKAFLPIVFLFLFGWFGFSPAWAIAELAVLVYHDIDPEASSDVSCTPMQFAEQMKTILQHGYRPLTMDETRLFLLGVMPEIQRPVLITFDDGYESVFSFALPIALQMRIPMTVFVVTSRIGLKPQFLQYLSTDQIARMADSGFFDFGSHTHDLHVNNVTISQAFFSRPNPFLSHVRQDLIHSKETLEAILRKPVRALAWPYGKYDWDMTETARECGFSLQFTSRTGYNPPGTNPLGIKRIPVTIRDTPATVLKKLRN